jgi:hypothetical protein
MTELPQIIEKINGLISKGIKNKGELASKI